jgi:hypothetical protein
MSAISDFVKSKGYTAPRSMVQYLEIHHFSVEDAEAALQQFAQIGYWECKGSAWGEKSGLPQSEPASGSESQLPPVTPEPPSEPQAPEAQTEEQPAPPSQTGAQ